ncbi:TPA: hypothetical protein J1487_004723 [Escherichia coli]|nr:hypothetical protein [Escherichia coli]HBA9842548.1 hypothetical protein [Escherichia coli]
MKWNDVYVLAFGSKDELSWKTAFALCLRYDIPFHKMAIFHTDEKKEIPSQYLGFLSNCTLQSKIIILAHGTQDYIDCSPFGQMSPVTFLLFLYHGLGLRKAGIISFKSCDLGAGFFLEKCKTNCELLFKDLHIGWLKAYKGISASHFLYNSCSFSSGRDDYFLREKTNCESKLNDDIRVKILKGNVDATPCDIKGQRWANLLNQ